MENGFRDQMEDIHIHLTTLIPESVPMARGKSLDLSLCPSLELRVRSGLPQRNELGAFTCMYVCVRMHTCVHMLPQQISKCITRKRKGFWNGKNSRRPPQGKCISLGLVPIDLTDLPIFFFGLFLAGLE